MGQELALELPLLLLERRLLSQPEQGKKAKGRKWLADEREVGQSVVEGPELHLETIGIVRWERVRGELDVSQPAVAGPELHVVVP